MATTWHVTRIEQQNPDTLELVCDSGQYPTTVSLASDDGRTFVVTACVPYDDPDPCSILTAFSLPDGAGDWAGACS